MTVRRPPAKSGVNWSALNFVLALSLAILNGVWGWFIFNSSISADIGTIKADIAVLKTQVDDLRDNQRELLRERRDRERAGE